MPVSTDIRNDLTDIERKNAENQSSLQDKITLPL